MFQRINGFVGVAAVMFLTCTLFTFNALGQSQPQDINKVEDNTKFQIDDDVKSALNRATEDAEKTAVRDDKGKIKQITARVFSDTYQSYQLDYEKDNIAGVTNEKGERLRFLRDKQGDLRGIEFPNGGKALFQFHKSKNGVLSVDGITFVRPDGTIRFEFNSSQSTNFQQINFSKAGLSSKFAKSSNRKLLDACSRAINTAGAIGLATAVACASRQYYGCASGAVATAVAVANAIEICNEDQVINSSYAVAKKAEKMKTLIQVNQQTAEGELLRAG